MEPTQSSGNDNGSETDRFVACAMRGDPDAIAWIVDRFGPLLTVQAKYRISGRLAQHTDPEDIVQIVWNRVIPKLGSFVPTGRATPYFVTWLGTTLLNVVRDLAKSAVVRRETKSLEDSEGRRTDVADRSAGTTTRELRQDRIHAVQRAIATLSPEDQRIVINRALEGGSNAFVATTLGITPNAAAQRYHRALLKLRKQLPGSVFEDFADS